MTHPARQVRIGFCAALLPRGAVWGLAAALVPCAVVILSARLLERPVPFVWGVAVAALGACVGLAWAARGVPSREACRALADDAAHAGGLILVADLPGADLWPRPNADALPRPPCRLKRPLFALGVSAALCLAAACVPLPRASAPQSLVPQALMEAEEEEIEQLAEEADLSAEELEEVREEVRRIVEAAPGVGAAETVDALNRVADRLRYGEALARDAARRAAEPRTARLSAAESAALQQALSETLAQSPSSDDVTENGTGEGDGEGGTSQPGDGEGEGDRPGSGGATRGPGAAVISWTDPVGLGASRLKDISREADPTKDESTRIGEAADEWDSVAPAAPRGPATCLAAPRTTGAGHAVQRVLPRHRAAVRRYFSTERNEP